MLSQICAVSGKMGGNRGWIEILYDLCVKAGNTCCENPPKALFCLIGRGVADGHHKGRQNGGKWGEIGDIGAD